MGAWTLDDWLKVLGVLFAVLTFVGSQLLSYVKLRDKVEKMGKSINGVGAKLTSFQSESQKENRSMGERLAHIEGFLKGTEFVHQAKNETL